MARDERTNEYNAIPIKSESLLWKTAKLGAFFGLTGMALKKTKINKEYSDMISFGLVAAGTLLNTDDDESYSEDFTALGSLLAVYSGHKAFKQSLEDPEFFKKAYKYADKADNFTKDFNIFTSEVYRRTTDSIAGGIADAFSKNFAPDNENALVSKVFGMAKDTASVIFGTFSSGVKKLFEQKTNIVRNIVDDSEYKRITDYNKDNPEYLEVVKHLFTNGAEDSLGVDIEDKSGFTKSAFKKLMEVPFFSSLKPFFEGSETLTEVEEEKAIKEIQKYYKRSLRYKKISDQSFFKDILGEFTEFDGEEKSANLGKIIKDGFNYANSLNIQVKDYLEENKGRNRDELTSQDFVNWLENKYQSLDSSDSKEQIGKMIKSFYNQDNKVKFSDLEKYVGKQISLSGGSELPEDRRLMDENIINYILHSNQGTSTIFNTSVSKFTSKDGTTKQFIEITGINNYNLLKDFTFTDVVEYGENKELVDKTMGSGTLFMHRLMGIAENSINAFYHNGLISKSPTIQRWNPTSLLDSAARRKEYIANEINRMSAVKQEGNKHADIIIDGIHFTTVKTESNKSIHEMPEEVVKLAGKEVRRRFGNIYGDEKFFNDSKLTFATFEADIEDVTDATKKRKLLEQKEEILTYASWAYAKQKSNKYGKFTEEEWNFIDKDRTINEWFDLIGDKDNEDLLHKVKSVFKKNNETRYITQSTKQNDYKQIFRKKIVEAATEEISYANRNVRTVLEDGELKNTKGVWNKVKKLSNTEYNVTPFRFQNGEWVANDPKDDFFMEDNTIIHKAIGKTPFLKRKYKNILDRDVDPNLIGKANAEIYNKTREFLQQAIDLMHEDGNYSPELLKPLKDYVNSFDPREYFIMNTVANAKKFMETYKKGKNFDQAELDSFDDVIRNISKELGLLSSEDGLDEAQKQARNDEGVRFITNLLKNSTVNFAKGNDKEGIAPNHLMSGFFKKELEQFLAFQGAKEIINKATEGKDINLTVENINKALKEKNFLIKKPDGTYAEIKNGVKEFYGNFKNTSIQALENKLYTDQGMSLMEGIVKNVSSMAAKGAKTQEEAEAIINEVNKFKPLFYDILGAVNAAKEDTFSQGSGNDLKGFIRNEVLKMKGIGDENDRVININEDSFKINLGNRLYNILQKSNNKEILFDGNPEAQKRVEDAYQIYEDLSQLMNKNFDSRSKYVKNINKRINAIEGTRTDKVSTFNDLSFEDKMNMFKSTYYKTNENQATSVILRTGLDYDISLKNILTKLREFFFETSKNVEERKKAFEEKIIKHISKQTNVPIKKITTSFGSYHKRDNVFNSRVKGWVSAAETAFEQLGIPRLSNIGRNVTWNERWKDFMLKRVGVISGIALGAMAVDSFSDALVPDQIPIIGNGISGALAWGAATTRVGAQYAMNYTGVTSIFRGLDNATNGLLSGLPFMDTMGMDAGELYDIHFKGKAVRVNKNRFWHTAGRQPIQGEEFDQYRPSALYTLMNKTTGVRSMSDGYIGKWQKFFRKDFLPTKYPWYIIDPYREERIAYKKYGAVYPMTEQLFKDIPVVGDFMSATIGQIIKPTQLVGKERWLENGKIKNPDWKPGSDVPKYIEYKQPGIIGSLFSGFEDVKTLAGLQGYAITKGTEFLFGKSNPYERDITLASLTDDISYASEYNKYNLGGIFNLTEPIRRLVDDPNSLNMTAYNPLRQKLPYWMPEYFKKGNNPIMKYNMGSYIGPTGDFNKTMNHIDGNENLNRFRILSMIAPKSKEFEDMRNRVLNKIDDMSIKERTHYYESLGYAEQYGKREYANTNSRIKGGVEEVKVTIQEKLTPYEFIGTDNKRYKLDTVTKDFNKLSSRYGRKTATSLMSKLDDTFKEGQTYAFKIANNATFSAGIDDEGDFLRVDSDLVSKKLNLDKSSYRKHVGFNPLAALNRKIFDVALPMKYEKYMGKKTVFEEWSRESVESNYFRDWDSPVDSFIAPYFTLSSNSLISATAFGRDVNEAFEGSSNSTNFLGAVVNLGKINYFKNAILRTNTVSGDYKEETEVHDKIEQYKLLAGKRNVYQLTGKEYFSQVKNMVNEQDSKMLMDLINVSNESEREKILSSGNDRIRSVLKMIWNRHQKLVNGNTKYENWRLTPPKQVSTFGIEYNSNQEYMKNRIKQNLGYSFSKLDSKRQGIYNSYVQDEDYDYIKRKMMEEYGTMPQVASTIYSSGEMFINNNF